MKRVIYCISIICIIFILISCDSNRGNLTRSKAKNILKAYIKNPPAEPLFPVRIRELKFRKNGLERAIQDGIVKNDGSKFTDKGLKYVESLIETKRWYGWDKRIEIADNAILLKKPMQIQIGDIEGIADTTQGESFKLVKFYTLFIFPEKIKPISGYFLSGWRHEVIFRKYDDGWRIETVPFNWW